MLIVCTQDPVIRQAAADPAKGGANWGRVVQLPPGPQPGARVGFAASLQRLRPNEALCLSAHGSDFELGDEEGGWGWGTTDVAALLVENVGSTWTGPVLVHACAETVANFSAGLAVALEQHQSFEGLWCYGYNRPLPSEEGYPPPVDLARRVDLQGTQVRF